MNQEAAEMGSPSSNKQMYRIYNVIERPGEQKNYWQEVGMAFVNRDSSISCKLNCLPVDGKLQLRQYEPKQKGSMNQSSPKSWQREGF